LRGNRAERSKAKPYDEIMLKIPAEPRAQASRDPARRRRFRGKTDIDPIILINGLGFSRFLKSQRDFSDALQAAHEYEHPDDLEAERDRTKDPVRATLMHSMKKLDCIDLLLLRRRMRADMIHDNILACNLYSDSSPVSGTEIQGMVLDINRRDGNNERIELPGANLSYGLFDSISKAICCLHAFWLITGTEDVLLYLCSKVASVCTDFGTEMHTIEMRNVSAAYCVYMDGADLEECRRRVDTTQRWLPNAVRISGWSHTMGNIMRETAEASPRWPTLLDEMRSLVDFMRNATWREFMQDALQLHPPEDFELRELEHLSCSLAKWRYETIAATTAILVRFRVLFQRHIRAEWFSKAQDKEQLRKMLHAADDEFLWKFLAVSSREVWGPVEKDRHWGMICRCPAHVRDRVELRIKHISCWLNGRNLRGAWTYIKGRADAYLERSRQLTREECENDPEVHHIVTYFLKADPWKVPAPIRLLR